MDEDDGKDPWTIGQREMVKRSADDVYILVDDHPIALPEQGHEMHDYTPRPQPEAPAPWPQIPEHCSRPRTQKTNPLSGLEDLGLATLAKTSPGGTQSA